MGTIRYGDTVYLHNMYPDPNNPTGGSLVQIGSGGVSNIVTSLTPSEDSGTWQIVSAKKANPGSKVKMGDVIWLRNMSAKKHYLCATSTPRGADAYDTYYYVQSLEKQSDDDMSEAGWVILGLGDTTGDTLEENTIVLIKSHSSNFYLQSAYTANMEQLQGDLGVFTGNVEHAGETQQEWKLTIASTSGENGGDDNNGNNNNGNGNNNNGNGNNNNGTSAGAGSVTLALTPGVNFGVTVLTNTAGPHQVVLSDAETGDQIASLSAQRFNSPSGKDPLNNGVISTATYNSGSTGRIKVEVKSGDNVCTLKSTMGSVDGTLKFSVVGASDDAKDVFHDCIVFINYPIRS